MSLVRHYGGCYTGVKTFHIFVGKRRDADNKKILKKILGEVVFPVRSLGAYGQKCSRMA